MLVHDKFKVHHTEKVQARLIANNVAVTEVWGCTFKF